MDANAEPVLDSTTTEFLSPTKYAQHLGISLQAVRDATRKHPTLAEIWAPSGGKVDVKRFDAAWRDLFRTGAVKTPAPGQDADDPDDEDEDDDETLAEGKRRKVMAEAKLAEARLAKLQRELIPVAEVIAEWTRITGAIDSMLDALPSKAAARLPGDRRETTRLLRELVRSERDALAQRVEVEAQIAESVELDDEEDVEPQPTKGKSNASRPS